MKWFLKALVLPICLSLAGCDAYAEKPATATPDQIRLAANPGYSTSKGVRQESLGRLIFDVPWDMEWGIHKMNNQGKRYGFPGGKAFLEYGTVAIEGMEIHVMDSALKSDLADRVESDNSRKDNSIQELTEDIESLKRIIDGLKINENKEDPKGVEESIRRHEAKIKDYQARIKRLSTEHYPIDMGIPDSAAFQSGGILHGYLWREGRLYCFDKGFDRIPTAEEKMNLSNSSKLSGSASYTKSPRNRGSAYPTGSFQTTGSPSTP